MVCLAGTALCHEAVSPTSHWSHSGKQCNTLETLVGSNFLLLSLFIMALLSHIVVPSVFTVSCAPPAMLLQRSSVYRKSND